jgi:hypothetical protein
VFANYASCRDFWVCKLNAILVVAIVQILYVLIYEFYMHVQDVNGECDEIAG